MKMKKKFIIIALLVVLVLWGVGQGVKRYNNLVQLQEEVNKEWSNVESRYQLRADEIPNLMNIVKGYAEHERETLEAVIEARSKATSIKIDPENLTPESLKEYQETQGAVGSALGRLITTIESYPDLKADEHFKEFQSQLEGIENRIAVARRDFNEKAKIYNSELRRFPTNIIAGIFNFDARPYFEAAQGSDKAPQVKF